MDRIQRSWIVPSTAILNCVVKGDLKFMRGNRRNLEGINLAKISGNLCTCCDFFRMIELECYGPEGSTFLGRISSLLSSEPSTRIGTDLRIGPVSRGGSVTPRAAPMIGPRLIHQLLYRINRVLTRAKGHYRDRINRVLTRAKGHYSYDACFSGGGNSIKA